MATSEQQILQVNDIEVIYGGAILALRGVALSVARGSVVALLGANGAGKTTTLKAVSQLVETEGGAVVSGSITFQGQDTRQKSSRDLVKAGLVQVLEGRHCFQKLTVEQNLFTGAFVRNPTQWDLRRDLDRVYTWFPRLKTKRSTLAGFTSGGEQQMLAIGRALMAHPQLLLLDEPSMGLAPLVVEEIFQILRDLNQHEGVSILLAEQNATLALQHADHGYILENGRVATSGTGAELRNRDDVKHFYLGIEGGERRSFRGRHHRPAAVG